MQINEEVIIKRRKEYFEELLAVVDLEIGQNKDEATNNEEDEDSIITIKETTKVTKDLKTIEVYLCLVLQKRHMR